MTRSFGAGAFLFFLLGALGLLAFALGAFLLNL